MDTAKKNRAGLSILGLLVLAIAIVLILRHFDIGLRFVSDNPARQQELDRARISANRFLREYPEKALTSIWDGSGLKKLWYEVDKMLDEAGQKLTYPVPKR